MAQINPDTGRIYLDNTILTAVANCDTQALMRYCYNLTSEESTAPLTAGTAAHEALAHFFRVRGRMQQRGRTISAAGATKLITECLDIHKAFYAPWAATRVPEDDRLSISNTTAVLEGWFTKHVHHYFPFRIHPELVEIGFALPLDPDSHYIFCGRLDALVETDAGWYVLDHKTTGRLDITFFKKFRLGSQFSGYNWAAAIHTHKPIIGSYVNAIEFSKLPGGGEMPWVAPRLKKDGTPYKTRECKIHGTSYSECRLQHVVHDLRVTTRTPQALEAWRRSAVFLATKFERLMQDHPTILQVSQHALQQGQFNDACKWCDFQDWCGTDRPVQHVRGMFVENEWKPFDYAFPFGEPPPLTDGGHP